MNTSLEKECALDEFFHQGWANRRLLFNVYAPYLVRVHPSVCRIIIINAELQTHFQDDNLFNAVVALMFSQTGTDVYYPGGMKARM